ncbi:MAG: hypothetical protein OEM67_04145 [Thermoleophilia bacterium]|nr:hypothetical protein [Thermoleophilia bacterium]
MGSPESDRRPLPVQFVERGDRADLAIVKPGQYCQAAPALATTCFVSGDHSVDCGEGAPGANDALVAFPWEATDFAGAFPPEGWPAATRVPAPSWTQKTGPKPDSLASVREVGAVWGLAFDRTEDRLFASAMVKRHADLGDLGTGGIYAVDNATRSGPAARPWLDLTTLSYPADMASPLAGSRIRTGLDPRNGTVGNQELPPRVDLPSHDVAAFLAVGTRGVGDIDIDASGATLWIVNLHDRTLLAIDTGRRSLRGAWEIPDPGCRVPDDPRPSKRRTCADRPALRVASFHAAGLPASGACVWPRSRDGRVVDSLDAGYPTGRKTPTRIVGHRFRRGRGNDLGVLRSPGPPVGPCQLLARARSGAGGRYAGDGR